MKMQVFLLVGVIICLIISCLSNLRVGKADEMFAVYIRFDGSVYPPDAAVRSNGNNLYVLTSNITVIDNSSGGVKIERSNVILDGSGFTLQGANSLQSPGIDISDIHNVTVENTRITKFSQGIFLNNSERDNILENTIVDNNGNGISLWVNCTNDTISGNNALQNVAGIGIRWYSDNNNVFGNNVTKNQIGIEVFDNYFNRVYGNNISLNWQGINVDFSSTGWYYSNNFVNNTNQAVCEDNSINMWTDGAAGNFWSDYQIRYPNATEIDKSGIWNTPYVVEPYLNDTYPLVKQYTSGAPRTILYEGNLYINSSQIYQIHNCLFNLTGTIFVQDNSTLDIENTILTLMYRNPSASNPNFDFLFATNESHVCIKNTTIIIQAEDWGAMYALDNAFVQVLNCNFFGWSRSWLETDNYSRIDFENSEMLVAGSGLYASGSSSIWIKNSTLFDFDLTDNSTGTVDNSRISEYLQACVNPGKTVLNIINSFVDTVMNWGEGSCKYDIRNSTINWLQIGPNSSATLVGTSGNQLNIDDKSVATLIDCSWNQIYPRGNSLVLIKNWFFGLSIPWVFSVPFDWVSPLEFLFVLETLITIGVLWHFLRSARSAFVMKSCDSDLAEPA